MAEAMYLIFPAKTLKMLCREHARYLITVCWMNVKKKQKTCFESIYHLVSRLEIVGHGFNLVTHTLLRLNFITILGNRQHDHPHFSKGKFKCRAICRHLIPDLQDSEAYALNHCTWVGAYTCGVLRFQLLLSESLLCLGAWRPIWITHGIYFPAFLLGWYRSTDHSVHGREDAKARMF